MKALPTVEIYVRDASYIQPDLSGDRAVYIPLFSEKGPDNTIEKCPNTSYILERYGKPNAQKYGFGLYYALKAALYSSEVYITRLLPEDATYANKKIKIDTSDFAEVVQVQSDVKDSDTIPLTSDKVDLFNIGDKIYFGNDYKNIYEVVDVIKDDTTSTYQIKIDKNVTVPAGTEIHKVPRLIVNSVANANDTSELEGALLSDDSLFVLYPIGRGEYYNKLQVVFVRNTSFEYLYVDKEGNPLYPYMFYDVYIYEVQEDGGIKLVEDPITVSLAPQAADGTVFRHPTTGKELFIETRINEDSDTLRCIFNHNLISDIVGTGPTDTRALVARYIFNTLNEQELQFENGSDGSLFTSSGALNWTVAKSLLISCYRGELNDEIAKLLDTNYQYYLIDYVPDCGYPVEVKAAIREFCDIREDCLGIISTPNNSKYTQDLEARLNDLPYNSYNVIIYSQYREIFDPYTGKKIQVPASYHALEAHLHVDNTMGIAEPVAMFKAMLQEPAKLVYSPLFSQANDLASVQVNPTVQEPDGTYIPTQYTAYKRFSILQRAHAVKVLHKFRKDIKKLLKPLLQRKATPDVIKDAKRRIEKYLSEWKVGASDFTKEAITNYSVNVKFDDASSTLYILIDVKFVRAIEHIKVFMTVR